MARISAAVALIAFVATSFACSKNSGDSSSGAPVAVDAPGRGMAAVSASTPPSPSAASPPRPDRSTVLALFGSELLKKNGTLPSVAWTDWTKVTDEKFIAGNFSLIVTSVQVDDGDDEKYPFEAIIFYTFEGDRGRIYSKLSTKYLYVARTSKWKRKE